MPNEERGPHRAPPPTTRPIQSPERATSVERRRSSLEATRKLSGETDLTQTKMQNIEGKVVDLYIPRKCSWTNRLITADDRGAVQFRIAHVNEQGVAKKNEGTYIALCGFIRSKGEADMAVNELAKKVPGLTLNL